MSRKTNADVTAVIACFNYGRYLDDAVRSALDQEGGSPNVVVVDDGSTEPQTLAALEELPPEVELVRQENRGVCATRNAGLARLSTPYAIVLDADDRLAPGALAALRAPLEADPDLGYSYGLMEQFGAREGVIGFPPFDSYRLLYRHTIGLSALMRREVVEATGGFDPAFEAYEDWELWINALAHGWRGRQIDRVTLHYRRHPGNEGKQLADRRRYRRAFRAMREKHAALYRDRARLAAESELGPTGRAVQRFFWGARPVPARLEAFAHGLLWRARS